jgi:competence protein ComEA
MKTLRIASGLLLCATLAFAAVAHGKKIPPAVAVNLNTATSEELQQVPGIGPGTAKAITSFREKSGRFQRVEDLLSIRGITPRKLDAMRPFITTGNPAAKTPAPKQTSKR